MFFLKLIRFLFGYVRFTITGEFPERLINQLSVNHISIWNTVRNKENIEANIMAKDYKKIRKIRGKNRVKTKIKRKYGFPFFIKKNSKRVGILVGAVLFVLIINFLSSRIWYIRVEGNQNITTNQVLSVAEEYGLKIGIKKRSINSIKLKSKLAKSLKDSAWVAVNVEGSRVTLNITENLVVPEKTKTYPCNLIAECDGVITKLLVKDGVTKVRVNQAVQKGDLLVSGTIEYKEGESDFKHAMGEILAKTERKIIVTQNYKETISEYTGKEKMRTVLSVFGLNIPLYLGEITDDYEKELKIIQYKNDDMALPIFLYSAKFSIKQNKKVNYSEETAQKLALIKMENKEKEMLKECEILQTDEKIVNYKNSVKIIRTYSCIENIAKEEKITVNTTN